MIHFACDICGSIATETEFVLPVYDVIIISSINRNVHHLSTNDIAPQKFHLCAKCKKKIISHIEKMKRGV